MPLKACSSAEKENPAVSGELSASASPLSRGGSGNFGIGESKCVDNGGSKVFGDGGDRGFSAGLRPCSNKRKDREDDNRGDGSSSSAFRGVDRSSKAVLGLGIILDSLAFHLFQLFMVILYIDYMHYDENWDNYID